MMIKKRSKSEKSSRVSSRKKKTQRSGLPFPKAEMDFFRHMVDQIGDELLVADGQGRIVFVNDATVKGLGYVKKNIINRPVMDFLEEKLTLRQFQSKYFFEIKKRRKPISFIVNRLVKGKKIRTIQVTAAYMPYQSKDYVLTVGRDITEQLAFQTKLKASEDRYRLLSEQASEGILMVDISGHIRYANKAATNIFRVPLTKVVGTHFERYMDSGSVPKAWACFKKVRAGESSMCADLNIKDKNGKIIPSEFLASPIFEGKRVTQIHVIFRDMRQRKKMEALVLESEKMKGLQNFVAGTTREIQLPLKGLMLRSRGMIDRYKNRHFEYIGYKEFSDIMKTLQSMHDQIKYCFDTTARIVNLNRRKVKLQNAFCSVNPTVRAAVGMLKHSFEVSDIHVRLRLSSSLPQVAIGSLELSQVLNNILTNSIQSLPGGGGKVQITTKHQKAKGYVRIDCQDDGVGIPKEVLARVFEPFFTTKPRGLEKSSGLGLSIVYSIVKTHHGEISIKSDHRKGTFVTILLPVYKKNRKSK